MKRTVSTLVAILALSSTLTAQEHKKDVGDDKRGYTDTPQLPGQPWKVHDAARPRPPKVTPGLPLLKEAPPSDAVVLFDGKDLSQWTSMGRDGKAHEPLWKIENGILETTPNSGALVTKDKFGDIQLHLEWMIPMAVEGAGQGRGNSGVELMRRYEIQVLESFQNVTYADGQASALYGQWPPLVNATRPQGEWNVYDILFEAPKFEGEKLVKPGYVTVICNGVLVHHHKEILGKVIHRKVATYQPHGPEEPLSLQDHKQVVRYRNIWLRRLKGYDQQ